MERLDPAALAWLVASVDADNPAAGIIAGFLPPAARDTWTKLSALAVSVRADGTKLTLTMHIRGKDAAAGEAAGNAVMESLKKAALAPERTAKADWQTVNVTTDAEKIAGWMQKR